MADELRRCRDCGEEKPSDAFAKLKGGKDGLRPHCKPCAAVRLRIWRENNKDHVRAYYAERNKDPERQAKKNEYNRQRYRRDPDMFRRTALVRNFGITIDEYNEMLTAQDNACAICKTPAKAGDNSLLITITLRARSAVCCA